jgi:hypothetical protein
MTITAAFIIFVAWSTFVLTAASHYGRGLHRVHRAARAVFVAGVALSIPVTVVGSFGLPTTVSFQWLGVVARIGYVSLTLAVAGAFAWLISDSVFVWQHRRQVFPFAFRRPPGGKS